MVKSMTGFGRGQVTDDKMTVTVEIKAVNHRYCDISVRMPRRLAFAEEAVKAEIKKRMARGKIEVSVSIDNFGKSESDIRLNIDLANKYFNALSELRDNFKLNDESFGGGNISLSLLAKMPEVISSAPAEEDEEMLKGYLINATQAALDELNKMREIEGGRLADDILMRADIIEGIRAKIEKRAPELEGEYANKLRERINELLKGVAEIPEERVALEAAIFADKANITEELVRLASHLSQLRAFMNTKDEAVGKKVDFLIQEMNREANTIGSKSNDNEITAMMLDLKAEIEKIREQVQNIE